MYVVYVLSSLVASKAYVGMTNDISRRLQEHNNGKHSYTKRYIPWKLIYLEGYPNRISARVAEKYLKSASGRRWLKKYIF